MISCIIPWGCREVRIDQHSRGSSWYRRNSWGWVPAQFLRTWTPTGRLVRHEWCTESVRPHHMTTVHIIPVTLYSTPNKSTSLKQFFCFLPLWFVFPLSTAVFVRGPEGRGCEFNPLYKVAIPWSCLPKWPGRVDWNDPCLAALLLTTIAWWLVFHEEYSLFLNFSDSASFKYNQWISLHFLCNFTRIYRFRENKKTHVNKVLNNFNLQQKLKIQKDTLKNCSAFLSRDCDSRLLWPGLQKSNLPLEIWPIYPASHDCLGQDFPLIGFMLCFSM